MDRTVKKQVMVGAVPIGGGAPVSIQSMTNTPTQDTAKTLRQIRLLAKNGCDIVRVTVNHREAALAVPKLVAQSPVPLVADIHFDYRLAIMALEGGIAKLRINPGNIGGEAHVAALADCLKRHHVPVRIGVNSGSIERPILEKYGGVTPQGMVDSALGHARMLEKRGFDDIVLSLKGTQVPQTVEAYQLASKACDYPLHVGFTHVGTREEGTVKTAAGVGALLLAGVGDTLRVSLTGSPLQEVTLAKEILRAVGLRNQGVTVISCPTCGRVSFDVETVARKVRRATRDIQKPLTVAVMGCVVNGPGEARQADIGICGAPGGCAIFMGDQVIRVSAENALEELLTRVRLLADA